LEAFTNILITSPHPHHHPDLIEPAGQVWSAGISV
jgi:hypothetical protein